MFKWFKRLIWGEPEVTTHKPVCVTREITAEEQAARDHDAVMKAAKKRKKTSKKKPRLR